MLRKNETSFYIEWQGNRTIRFRLRVKIPVDLKQEGGNGIAAMLKESRFEIPVRLEVDESFSIDLNSRLTIACLLR